MSDPSSGVLAGWPDARQTAERLAALMEQRQLRFVLAESCSGGMAAAVVTGIPGVSNHFCGSAVTYREATKQQWLGVPSEILEEFTAESQATSDQLALRALTRTPEADISAAITGHLGPVANQDRDGQVFIAVARRHPEPTVLLRQEIRLKSNERVQRQLEAADRVLDTIVRALSTDALTEC